MNKRERSEYAKKLSELGAAKGGRARASVLTESERREIATKAAIKRWEKAGKRKEKTMEDQPVQGGSATVESGPTAKSESEQSGMPFSMFRGTLKIGDLEVECHVLSNGTRVLTQREMVRV